MLCMKLLFMCVTEYDILVIYRFLCEFPLILADLLLPGSGSASLIWIRIQDAKMILIRPDPHHCFELALVKKVKRCLNFSDLLNLSVQNLHWKRCGVMKCRVRIPQLLNSS